MSGSRVPYRKQNDLMQFYVAISWFYNSSKSGHIFDLDLRTKANSAFHPSGVGKWVPASAGKAKAGMVHSVSGWTRGVKVKLWDPLRTRAITDRLKGEITTKRYTNPRLPLRVLKGSHSFTYTPRVHAVTEWTIPAFAFPAESGPQPTPEGWKANLARWLVTYRGKCSAPGV